MGDIGAGGSEQDLLSILKVHHKKQDPKLLDSAIKKAIILAAHFVGREQKDYDKYEKELGFEVDKEEKTLCLNDSEQSALKFYAAEGGRQGAEKLLEMIFFSAFKNEEATNLFYSQIDIDKIDNLPEWIVSHPAKGQIDLNSVIGSIKAKFEEKDVENYKSYKYNVIGPTPKAIRASVAQIKARKPVKNVMDVFREADDKLLKDEDLKNKRIAEKSHQASEKKKLKAEALAKKAEEDYRAFEKSGDSLNRNPDSEFSPEEADDPEAPPIPTYPLPKSPDSSRSASPEPSVEANFQFGATPGVPRPGTETPAPQRSFREVMEYLNKILNEVGKIKFSVDDKKEDIEDKKAQVVECKDVVDKVSNYLKKIQKSLKPELKEEVSPGQAVDATTETEVLPGKQSDSSPEEVRKQFQKVKRSSGHLFKDVDSFTKKTPLLSEEQKIYARDLIDKVLEKLNRFERYLEGIITAIDNLERSANQEEREKLTKEANLSVAVDKPGLFDVDFLEHTGFIDDNFPPLEDMDALLRSYHDQNGGSKTPQLDDISRYQDGFDDPNLDKDIQVDQDFFTSNWEKDKTPGEELGASAPGSDPSVSGSNYPVGILEQAKKIAEIEIKQVEDDVAKKRAARDGARKLVKDLIGSAKSRVEKLEAAERDDTPAAGATSPVQPETGHVSPAAIGKNPLDFSSSGEETETSSDGEETPTGSEAGDESTLASTVAAGIPGSDTSNLYELLATPGVVDAPDKKGIISRKDAEDLFASREAVLKAELLFLEDQLPRDRIKEEASDSDSSEEEVDEEEVKLIKEKIAQINEEIEILGTPIPETPPKEDDSILASPFLPVGEREEIDLVDSSSEYSETEDPEELDDRDADIYKVIAVRKPKAQKAAQEAEALGGLLFKLEALTDQGPGEDGPGAKEDNWKESIKDVIAGIPAGPGDGSSISRLSRRLTLAINEDDYDKVKGTISDGYKHLANFKLYREVIERAYEVIDYIDLIEVYLCNQFGLDYEVDSQVENFSKFYNLKYELKCIIYYFENKEKELELEEAKDHGGLAEDLKAALELVDSQEELEYLEKIHKIKSESYEIYQLIIKVLIKENAENLTKGAIQAGLTEATDLLSKTQNISSVSSEGGGDNEPKAAEASADMASEEVSQAADSLVPKTQTASQESELTLAIYKGNELPKGQSYNHSLLIPAVGLGDPDLQAGILPSDIAKEIARYSVEAAKAAESEAEAKAKAAEEARPGGNPQLEASRLPEQVVKTENPAGGAACNPANPEPEPSSDEEAEKDSAAAARAAEAARQAAEEAKAEAEARAKAEAEVKAKAEAEVKAKAEAEAKARAAEESPLGDLENLNIDYPPGVSDEVGNGQGSPLVKQEVLVGQQTPLPGANPTQGSSSLVPMPPHPDSTYLTPILGGVAFGAMPYQRLVRFEGEGSDRRNTLLANFLSGLFNGNIGIFSLQPADMLMRHEGTGIIGVLYDSEAASTPLPIEGAGNPELPESRLPIVQRLAPLGDSPKNPQVGSSHSTEDTGVRAMTPSDGPSDSSDIVNLSEIISALEALMKSIAESNSYLKKLIEGINKNLKDKEVKAKAEADAKAKADAEDKAKAEAKVVKQSTSIKDEEPDISSDDFYKLFSPSFGEVGSGKDKVKVHVSSLATQTSEKEAEKQKHKHGCSHDHAHEPSLVDRAELMLRLKEIDKEHRKTLTEYYGLDGKTERDLNRVDRQTAEKQRSARERAMLNNQLSDSGDNALLLGVGGSFTTIGLGILLAASASVVFGGIFLVIAAALLYKAFEGNMGKGKLDADTRSRISDFEQEGEDRKAAIEEKMANREIELEDIITALKEEKKEIQEEMKRNPEEQPSSKLEGSSASPVGSPRLEKTDESRGGEGLT